MKQKIYWIRKKSFTGGAAYHSYLERFLADNYDLEILELKGRDKGNRSLPVYYLYRIIYRLKFLLRVLKVSFNNDIKIRDFKYTGLTLFMPLRGKNITLIHHIDRTTITRRRTRYNIKEFLFFLGAKKSDLIVTVSEYWRRYFLEKGYKNVQVAHNCFELKDYIITDKDVKAFKKRYKLTGKPIIYIGNCQEMKGVVETYDALKDLKVYLVTSGKKEIDIPAINLDLSKKDYITLLKASTIVLTMSKFNEGWCRTAHEAMLLGTPVIGSGRGGMKELLTEGKQVISHNLKEDFQKLMSHPGKLKKQGELGRRYARKFDYANFTTTWEKILNSL